MNTFLLIGLGNPGKQFDGTRHNLGKDVLKSFISELENDGAEAGDVRVREAFHGEYQEVIYQDIKIIALYPLVFMNECGKTVSQYVRYNPIDRKNILLIHDDLELPVGEYKFQESGSAKGHNGVRSIHEYLGDTEIPRLRIGIGRPVDGMEVEKFVLAKFTPEEKEVLQQKQHELFEVIVRRLTQE